MGCTFPEIIFFCNLAEKHSKKHKWVASQGTLQELYQDIYGEMLSPELLLSLPYTQRVVKVLVVHFLTTVRSYVGEIY